MATDLYFLCSVCKEGEIASDDDVEQVGVPMCPDCTDREMDEVDEDEFRDEYLHKGVECVYCDEVIEEEADGTSSPQGSMHHECASNHEAENPEEW